MILQSTRQMDGGHTCKTYISQEILDFPSKLVEYRTQWIEQWADDDIGRHDAEQLAVAQAVHLVALKDAVDHLGNGDSFSLPMYAIHNNSDYMVEFLKGRGDFTSSLMAVTKSFTNVAREVGQMEGYKYISYEQGWEIIKS